MSKIMKPLNFWAWLKIANTRQYKRQCIFQDRTPPRKFVRGYIEYLHNFKCGITKVMLIKNEDNLLK